MEKVKKNLEYLYGQIIYGFFLLIIMWLVLISGFSTSYINIVSEYTYYVEDNIWENLLICIIILGLLWVFRRKITNLNGLFERNNELFYKAKYLLLFCVGVMGAVIVFSSNTIPVNDQKSIVNAAYGLKHGDYAMFAKGGYVQECQNQCGIILFIYLLSIVCGDYNYITFQMLNVLALVLIYKELSEISELLEMNRICQLLVLIFGIVFLPLVIYTTFVYGTIIALALALLAIKHEVLFMKNFKTYNMLIASFAIAFSVILKNNSLIFMIAMIMYALVKFIGRHKIKTAMLIVVMILLYLVQSFGVSFFIEAKTGQPMEKGISSWAYVAMGLQEGYKADGWWNKYNWDTYYSNDCDSGKQGEEAKQYIKERLQYFANHKEYAIGFIGHKVASQWNNPTFQCFWIINRQLSNIEQPDWIKSMYNVGGQDKLERIFDVFQFIILMGCLIFVVFDHDKMDSDWLLIQMIVVGGFLFHILWEAKCQYTLPYFLLFVPVSIKGYWDIGYILKDTCDKISNKQYINIAAIFAVLFLGTIVFISFSNSKIIEKMIKIDDNADKYRKYVQFSTTDKIKDGDYDIYSFVNDELSIACLDLGEETNSKIGLMQNHQDNINITTKDDRVYLRFNDTALYLDLYGNNEVDNGLVWAHTKNDTDAQKWIIKRDKEYNDTFYILIGLQSALTYDSESGEIRIKEFSGCDAQKWIIK